MFRYFASLQVIHADGSTQIYMTPEDFLRSITPGMTQPTGNLTANLETKLLIFLILYSSAGLGLDHFRRVDERACLFNK